MRELGGSRYIIKPSRTTAVDELYDASPNFWRVIDDLRKYLALAIAGNEAVQFTPILLLGEPGLGKTYFAKKLAHALGTGFEFVSMSSLTAGWVLTGASAQWHNARPGKVAQTLVEGDYANPVVVLDEVDKAGGDHRYDPMGALYGLLEPDTALHFKDEFIDVDMDASHILWVATANDDDVDSRPDPQPDERLRDRPPGRRRLAADRAVRLPRNPRRASLAVPARAGGERARARWRRFRRATCASSCSTPSAPRNSPGAITSFPKTSTRRSSVAAACGWASRARSANQIALSRPPAACADFGDRFARRRR